MKRRARCRTIRRKSNAWSLAVGVRATIAVFCEWLLFGPAHRAIINRLRARSGDRPTAILDVGCGTGVFAARIAAALPRATIWGVDLVAGMLAGGREGGTWRAAPRSGRGRSRATANDCRSRMRPSMW